MTVRGGVWRQAATAATGAFAGASAWLSAGVLAVTTVGVDPRIGALPPAWWLALLVPGGAALALALRPTRGQLAPVALLGLLWLPWLPTRLPAMLLVWEGPLESLVWLAVAGGIVWSRWLTSWQPRWPARPMRVAVVLSLAASLAGAWRLADRIPAGDEPHYLVITQSLLLDGDLRIENNHQRLDYAAYYDREMRPDFLRRGTDGQIYSIHAPGLAAFMLPGFAAGGYAGAVVTLALWAALGSALAWLAAFRLTQDAAAAWVAWLGVTASTTTYFHSFTLYPDGAGSAMVMAGVLLLVALETGWMPSVRALVATGVVLAALPWFHTRFALLSGVLGAATVLRLWSMPDRARRLAAFLVVPVVSCAGWFGMFRVIYGTWSPSAPYGDYTQSSLSALAPGLPGVLFDQQFGLLSNAPVLGAGVVGLLALWRRSRRLTIELLAVGVPYLCAVASYRMWWGGFSAPGRFAAAIVLPFVLPMAAGWVRWAAGPWRGLMGVLLALTLVLTGVRTWAADGALLYNDRTGADLVLDAASLSINLPQAFPALHRESPIEAVTDVLLWLAALALGWAALRVTWPRLPNAGTRWAATTGAAALIFMLGAQVVMADRITPVVTPSTSQMSFLSRWDPGDRPLVVQVGRGRVHRMDPAEVTGQLALASTVRVPVRQGQRPLLEIPQVPAGEYDVVVEGASRLSGTADVFVGRIGRPLARWTLEGRTSGLTGLVLRLPLDVHSVVIRGDEAAMHAVRRLTLRPRQLVVGRARPGFALRGIGYHGTEVFSVDENVWLEPEGLWVRGRVTARLVVQPEPGRTPATTLRVRNGAVANTVRIDAGPWHDSWALAPGETRDAPMPAAALAPTVVAVTSAEGFRPREVEPGNGDTRLLGVWVEVAGAPARAAQ